MGTVDFVNRNRFERRIGRRVEIEPVDVVWVVPRPGRIRRNRPPLELPGSIDNISVTGAAITGPLELELAPGTVAVVRVDGHESQIVVRHRALLADRTGVRMGVELPRHGSPLKTRIHSILDATLGRGDDAVLDVTDSTIEAHGEPVIEVRDAAAALAEALRALDPLLVDLSATEAGGPVGDRVTPRRASEIEPVAAPGVDAEGPSAEAERDRQLDDAFRLMDD